MKNQRNHTVLIWSLLLSAVVAGWAILFNKSFGNVSNAVFSFLTTDFAWLYLLIVLFFVVFVVAIAFSRFGKIKLGSDDSEPEYSTVSWFAMLFGCGMGVGLVFYGVAEPVSHFVNPPAGYGLKAGSDAAAQFAMKSAFMHWGIEPWAVYSVIGLALAYFMFRKNKQGVVSTTLDPLLGEGRHQGLRKVIDVLAVFATLAGVVTSLGLGTLQINSGLNYLFHVPDGLMTQIVIIVIITLIVIWSAVSGIDKGIKMISDANLYIALGIMAVAFIVGPKVEILNNFTNALGQYLNYFVTDSLHIDPYGQNSWIASWRVYYWAWFIAWGPFVGVFIARISKGRTIREFIMGVVLAPTLASLVWFSIFGSLGLNLGMKGKLTMAQMKAIAAKPETGLFVVLNQYPLGFIMSIVAIVLLCTFFITSANSGTFVLAMLTSNGDLNPPNKQKMLWGVLQAVTAVGLLMAGGLKPLQTISIAAAFPFIFIMAAICAALIRALKQDPSCRLAEYAEAASRQK